MAAAIHNLTGILRQIGGDDCRAASSAMELVYGHLRNMAAKMIKREFGRSTVTPTDLLHDVYIHHLHQRPLRIRNRDHFFAMVVNLMREVMVDYSRRRDAAKRGKGLEFVPFEECVPLSTTRVSVEREYMLNSCFRQLKELDPGVARVMELRYSLGCTIRETSELLGMPEWRVREDSDFGEVWLLDQLGFSSNARRAPNARAS